MNPSCHRLSLDIQDESSQVLLKVKRGDTRVRLYITLNDGGKHYSITDKCSATFSAVKPDKTVILDDCTIENNQILYEFSEQVTTNIGKVISEVNLYGSQNEKLTSAKFTILVCETVINGDEVISSSEYGALDSALTKVNTLMDTVNDKFAGGSKGQILVKGSDADYDAFWGDPYRKDITDINALAISNYQKIDQLERTALKDIHDLKAGADYREARIRVLETDAKQTDKDIANLYALSIGTGTIAETEIEDSYLGRKTGGTLDIIDGALTRVEKIEGDTVNVDGVLYSTSFKGVKSRGKNLIDFDKLVGGALVKNADGSYTITKTGNSNASIRVPISIPITTTSGNTLVTNSLEIIESTLTYNVYGKVTFIDDTTNTWYYTEPTATLSGNANGFTKPVKSIEIYISPNETDGAYVRFRNLMTRYGRGDVLPYQYKPYKEDTSFSLDSAVTLDKWDYIDVERKKLVRKTGVLVLNGREEYWGLQSTADTNGRKFMQTTVSRTIDNSHLTSNSIGLITDKEYVPSSFNTLWGVNGTADKVPYGINIRYYNGVTYIYVLSLVIDNNGTPLTPAEWRNYLAINPITVKYEMATPIETDIDIPDDYVARLNGVELIDDTGRTYTDLMVANNSVPKPKITQTYYTKV